MSVSKGDIYVELGQYLMQLSNNYYREVHILRIQYSRLFLKLQMWLVFFVKIWILSVFLATLTYSPLKIWDHSL